MNRHIAKISLLVATFLLSGEEIPCQPSQGGPSARVITTAVERGVAYLLEAQNRGGSWGSARNTKGLNIYAPVPGAHHAFRAAVTSLCISALLEAGGDGDRIEQAIQRGETWLLEHLPRLRRATPDALYNVWGHAYGIQALSQLLKRTSAGDQRHEKIRSLIEQQIQMLVRYELVDGGWGYYDFNIGSQKPAGSPTCFTTATVLVALHEAKEVGVDSPRKLVERALASIRRQQKPDFSYIYGEYLRWQPMRPVNRPGGSLGRSQACNLALKLWGDQRIRNEILASWLDRLLARNLWLDMGRKRPVPHESWFEVAGYFFYYGHYYAALVAHQLDKNDRPAFQRRLASVLLRLQEKDGSWWDYPLYDYHQQYGTAFALLSLKLCLE